MYKYNIRFINTSILTGMELGRSLDISVIILHVQIPNFKGTLYIYPIGTVEVNNNNNNNNNR